MTDGYDLESGPDPATFAAATPEPDFEASSEAVVHVVGIGPGNPEYLTPRAERTIREADVVVGFSTVVAFVEDRTDADVLTCGYRDEAETLSTFGERVAAGETGVAVAMGDPNHSGYQFVGKVQNAVEREADREGVERSTVRVVPGISSLQIAASRARTPMEEAEFVTLHKSGDLEADVDRLKRTVGERHLLVLPRPYDLMPGDLAATLLEAGAEPDLEALVLERLTLEDEQIHRFPLSELAEYAGGNGRDDTPFSDLVVLAVRRPVPYEASPAE
ncbi:cobalt-precorrin-7 (C(5))-methyltransferase [Natrarchaeobius chitinivorans]|uniref:Cobalt-precorrin-7 (C(5))-methyltransferase n=1 Tax=Natrarchaeobius chitinivorans TaxID=1679083 RepID=A0A3N6P401_NATCH|nr:cobalt-precorrin-7 (C(5))-methyltransferase [Natrarchaeobius chitinivorans]RQG92559.1 cobalt-precorrin-7 (C(5))-methyltransferase [Natrarchaeobius chitinivorans]